MILPLTLLLLATALSAVMAYGTNPFWAQFAHGFQLIMLTRRLQWPMVALVVLLCASLIVWVVSGKRRVWWMLGLMPVLALFVHRFATDPAASLAILDDPPMVSADQASFVLPGDYVIGVSFNGENFAYPFAEVYGAPVVMQAAHDRRFIVMWSAFANRAVAASVDRTLKARELEAVSMPANILLLYNGRLGQFINGVTGRTMDGKKPGGFESPTPTCKTTWQNWRIMHPDTSVLAIAASATAPRAPVLPAYPMPRVYPMPPGPGLNASAGQDNVGQSTDGHNDAGQNAAALDAASTPAGRPLRVALIACTQPAALPDDSIEAIVNTDSGPTPLLVLREGGNGGAVRAYSRELPDDLAPAFHLKKFLKHPAASLVDSDSGSAWTGDGHAIDGPLKGDSLRSIAVDDEVYWNVVGPWMPEVTLVIPRPEPQIAEDDDSSTATTKDPAATKRHRKKKASATPSVQPAPPAGDSP